MNSKLYLFLFFPLTLLLACNSNQPENDNTYEQAPAASGGVFLTADQVKYAGIEYGSISSKKLSSDVNARGELVLPVNAIADLVCQYTGQIKAVMVKEGDKVKRGQLVATLNSPEFINAQQRYSMVKNELVMLQQEYERQKELNKDKVSSDKYFQKAEAEYNVALAELKGLGLQLKMAGVDLALLENGHISAELKIISPLEGYVENIVVNPGKFVMQDERLMQVINREELLIELSVFEKDIMKIKPGQSVSFSLSNLNDVRHEATVISIGNIVQKDSRIVKVLAEFRNHNTEMLPGMFVASEIHTGEMEIRALPDEALVRTEGDKWFIYYTTKEWQEEKGTLFRSVPVETGLAQSGYSEVKLQEALPDDAMIVVSGAYFLKTEQAKQAE
ncbi:MAG: efflux RND transporter periplasmic adaptor subunit [Bacteroidales bacterium]|jgi:cobalt-zinc-cadmium efflux system membrane fusion protein|nr:efflux RND transporter periplasmic adaptor subunit [Bacteroidales bacterium]